MFGRILSVALLLSTFTGSSQAFALSDCPVDVECGTSPITMLAALPLSGLSVLAGTFVVPALVKSDTEEGPGYLSLMVANLLISTTVGLTVLADPMEVFGSGDDNRYLAANALLAGSRQYGDFTHTTGILQWSRARRSERRELELRSGGRYDGG